MFGRYLQTLLTVLMHPLLGIYLFKNGTKHLFIGKRLKCRRFKKHMSIKENFYLGNDARILFISEYHGQSYIPFLSIGQGVNIGNRFSCLCADSIEIGDRTLIASDVFISDYNHGVDIENFSSYGDTPLSTSPIIIGRGCWIGEKAVILPGAQLGNRCVVGAGSVVNKSFPDNSIIAGVPAKIVKRFDYAAHKWADVRNK